MKRKGSWFEVASEERVLCMLAAQTGAQGSRRQIGGTDHQRYGQR